jgi:hypothetical protein
VVSLVRASPGGEGNPPHLTSQGRPWDQRGTPKREKPGTRAGLCDNVLITFRKDWRARRDSNS